MVKAQPTCETYYRCLVTRSASNLLFSTFAREKRSIDPPAFPAPSAYLCHQAEFPRHERFLTISTTNHHIAAGGPVCRHIRVACCLEIKVLLFLCLLFFIFLAQSLHMQADHYYQSRIQP